VDFRPAARHTENGTTIYWQHCCTFQGSNLFICWLTSPRNISRNPMVIEVISRTVQPNPSRHTKQFGNRPMTHPTGNTAPASAERRLQDMQVHTRCAWHVTQCARCHSVLASHKIERMDRVRRAQLLGQPRVATTKVGNNSDVVVRPDPLEGQVHGVLRPGLCLCAEALVIRIEEAWVPLQQHVCA
jgi:hypothetical protein